MNTYCPANGECLYPSVCVGMKCVAWAKVIENQSMCMNQLDEQSKYPPHHSPSPNPTMKDSQQAAIDALSAEQSTASNQHTSLNELKSTLATIANRKCEFTLSQRRAIHAAVKEVFGSEASSRG